MTKQSEVVRFSCQGTALAGRYYRGDGRASCCIVMAHGFGLPAAAGLSHYAEFFAAAGYYVLVFNPALFAGCCLETTGRA
jgi:predicted alpha/beta hydrolase